MKARTCGCHSHNGLLLSPEGLAQRGDAAPGVDAMELPRYIDRVGSVSGSLPPGLRWDDELIEEQYRRFHNGS